MGSKDQGGIRDHQPFDSVSSSILDFQTLTSARHRGSLMDLNGRKASSHEFRPDFPTLRPLGYQRARSSHRSNLGLGLTTGVASAGEGYDTGAPRDRAFGCFACPNQRLLGRFESENPGPQSSGRHKHVETSWKVAKRLSAKDAAPIQLPSAPKIRDSARFMPS